MRILLATLAVSVMASAPRPAAAGIRVVGNTLGQECYESTLLAPTPRRNTDALAVCDRAVLDATVSAYNQAANHVNRAEIRLRVSDYQGALDDADTALKIHDGIGIAYLNRAASLVGLERFAEALPVFEHALALGVDRPQLAYFDRGIAKESLGDIKGAYLDYKKAADLDPGMTIARAQLTRFTVR